MFSLSDVILTSFNEAAVHSIIREFVNLKQTGSFLAICEFNRQLIKVTWRCPRYLNLSLVSKERLEAVVLHRMFNV